MPSIEKPKKKFHCSLKSLKTCLLEKQLPKSHEMRPPRAPEDTDPESRYFTACVEEDYCERLYATRMPNGHVYDQYGTLHILPPPEYTEYEEVAKVEAPSQEIQKTVEVAETPPAIALSTSPSQPQAKLTNEQRRRLLLILVLLFLVYCWGWPAYVIATASIAFNFPESWRHILGPRDSRQVE